MSEALQLLCFEDRQAPFVDTFCRTAKAAGYGVRLERPAADEPVAFREFRNFYQHLSPNPLDFELACFRRYFEAACHVADRQRVIIADSDLFVQLGPLDLPTELQDNADKVWGSIGRSNGIAETDISPHFSSWTGKALGDFCEFCIETYRNNFGDLEVTHRSRLTGGNSRASISDMTLFYLWVEREGVAFFDTNRVLGGVYIDHNISMTECANTSFCSEFGRKSLHFNEGKILIRPDSHEDVIPAILHLQGRYKLISSAVEEGRRIPVAVWSAYIQAGRLARKVASALGR